jgi:hypothetical protein
VNYLGDIDEDKSVKALKLENGRKKEERTSVGPGHRFAD